MAPSRGQGSGDFFWGEADKIVLEASNPAFIMAWFSPKLRSNA
jgi:hypothetical protein